MGRVNPKDSMVEDQREKGNESCLVPRKKEEIEKPETDKGDPDNRI